MNMPVDTSDPKRKIAAKIAKLLRRAERGDGPEADTARELAELLMSKHGIEVTLDDFDEVPVQKRDERVVLFTRERQRELWAQFLIQEIAPLYGCTPRPLQVGVGWTHCIEGPPAQLELCAIHLEYMISTIRATAEQVIDAMQRGWYPPSAIVREGVHWGAMDGLFERLRHKLMARATTTVGPEVVSTVVRLEPLLALPAAPTLAMRGDEIAVADGAPSAKPDDVHAERPPFWAWRQGYQAIQQAEPEPPDIVYQPVQALKLSEDLCERLRASQVGFVAALLRTPASALLAEGLDAHDLTAILSALAVHGLCLARETEAA